MANILVMKTQIYPAKIVISHSNQSNNRKVVPITLLKRFLAASALELLHLRLISSIALANHCRQGHKMDTTTRPIL